VEFLESRFVAEFELPKLPEAARHGGTLAHDQRPGRAGAQQGALRGGATRTRVGRAVWDSACGGADLSCNPCPGTRAMTSFRDNPSRSLARRGARA
jgi:hypothetical protein